MEYTSVETFLKTMRDYNTVKIDQVFETEDGPSLSVRCLHGTNTFEIIHSQTQEVIHSDSLEQATEYIVTFFASYDLSENA